MKEAKRSLWLEEFEDKACELGIYEYGKVCWDTAIHQYNKGLTVDEAINQMKEARNL